MCIVKKFSILHKDYFSKVFIETLQSLYDILRMEIKEAMLPLDNIDDGLVF